MKRAIKILRDWKLKLDKELRLKEWFICQLRRRSQNKLRTSLMTLKYHSHYQDLEDDMDDISAIV